MLHQILKMPFSQKGNVMSHDVTLQKNDVTLQWIKTLSSHFDRLVFFHRSEQHQVLSRGKGGSWCHVSDSPCVGWMACCLLSDLKTGLWFGADLILWFCSIRGSAKVSHKYKWLCALLLTLSWPLTHKKWLHSVLQDGLMDLGQLACLLDCILIVYGSCDYPC